MSNNSLLIKNANIVDGTGTEAFIGDVLVEDGVIKNVGNIDGEFETVIDANGLILAPGFIDIHTHFDPQLCWDGYATPSIEHGVTTVVTGNCSLSLAPIRNGGEEKIISMFQVIEDIKKPTFEAAVPFSWETFGDYLDHIKPNLGINVGALIGVVAAPWMLGQIIGGIVGAHVLSGIKAAFVRKLLIVMLFLTSLKLLSRGIEGLFNISIPFI